MIAEAGNSADLFLYDIFLIELPGPNGRRAKI